MKVSERIETIDGRRMHCISNVDEMDPFLMTIVSAYDLDILYDSSIVAATGVVFTTLLGDELSFEVFNALYVSTP